MLKNYPYILYAPFYHLRLKSIDDTVYIKTMDILRVELLPGHDIILDMDIETEYYEMTRDGLKCTIYDHTPDNVSKYDREHQRHPYLKRATSQQRLEAKSYSGVTPISILESKTVMFKFPQRIMISAPYIEGNSYTLPGFIWPLDEMDHIRENWNSLILGIPIMKKHTELLRVSSNPPRYMVSILPQYLAFKGSIIAISETMEAEYHESCGLIILSGRSLAHYCNDDILFRIRSSTWPVV